MPPGSELRSVLYSLTIPIVFYAATLGFKTAPNLEFDGNNLQTEIGTLATFSVDDDGARLNQIAWRGELLSQAIGGRALSAGPQLANKAIEGGKKLSESTKVAVGERKEARATGASPDTEDSATFPPALPQSLTAEPAMLASDPTGRRTH